MRILLDANILIRLAKPDDKQHETVVRALESLHKNQIERCIVPQCIYEFYVVATRPLENNGLGWEPTKASNTISVFRERFSLIHDSAEVYLVWQDFMTQYQVRGKPSHDARLAAAMIVHKIPQILTFNGGDFARFVSKIDVVDPMSF